MKWTRLELAILAWLIKTTPTAPTPTPRQRHLLLMAIRMCLVGTVIGLSSTAAFLVADWSTSTVVAITGIVLLVLGNALLLIAMILAGISSILGG